MIRLWCSGMLAIVALSSNVASGQSTSIQGGVTVTFRKEVSDAEALWVLRSYRVQFDMIRRRVSHLQIKANDSAPRDRLEQILIDASMHGALGRSVIRRSSLMLSDPQSNLLLLYGEICHNETLQRHAEHLLPKGTAIEWEVEPPYALVSVLPGTEDAWMRVFSGESSVQSTAVETWPNPASVTASSTVADTELTSPPPGQIPIANFRMPHEADIAGRRLPTAGMVKEALRTLYRGMDPRISIIKSERDVEDEYFEIVVDALKGSVTNPPFWEKLRYSIPIFLTSDHVLKIRCILDGQFAPGVGKMTPPDTAFQDLEPQYSGQLQDMVNRFVLALQTRIARGSYHD
jgi:hypothetical protein